MVITVDGTHSGESRHTWITKFLERRGFESGRNQKKGCTAGPSLGKLEGLSRIGRRRRSRNGVFGVLGWSTKS